MCSGEAQLAIANGFRPVVSGRRFQEKTKSMCRPVKDKILRRSALAAILLLGLVHAALGQTIATDLSAALGLIKSTTTQLLAAVSDEYERVGADPDRALRLVVKYVAPHVDMVRSSRRVLGRHWKRASADERVRFITEFRILLLRTYATAIAENPNVTVKYLPPRQRRKHEAIVSTEVPRSSGEDITVQYRLHNRSGSWKLYDVSIAGISLLVTYRSSFNQIIKRDGMSGLLASMHAKNNTTRS